MGSQSGYWRIMKQARAGATRTALIEAAIELIGTHGVEGWTIADLARAAGTSHGLPGHHFLGPKF